MKITIKQMQLKPGVSKDGRPYTKIGIFDGEKWYGTFQNKDNRSWKVGDTIEASVSQREYNGKVYYDLKVKTQMDRIEEKVDLLYNCLLQASLLSKTNGNTIQSVPTQSDSEPFTPETELPPDF